MQIQNNIIKQIQKIREKNNLLWCGVLDISFKYAPKEAKKIFKNITDNDKKINILSRKLCK